MDSFSVVHALGGGALIGLAASIALLAHGRIAGISGTLGRLFVANGGRAFRIPFLSGLVASGIVAAIVAPSAIGAAVRGPPLLAIAGVLVGVGTALRNGCTSGHGICGLSRGSGRSLGAVMTFMATGAITARDPRSSASAPAPCRSLSSSAQCSWARSRRVRSFPAVVASRPSSDRRRAARSGRARWARRS